MKVFFLLLAGCLSLFNAQRIVNPVDTPIVPSSRKVFVRKFAQLPKFRGRQPQRIVGITSHGSDLYVSANINGHIYKVSPSGRVSLWFNVAEAVKQVTGREMDFTKFLHGGLRTVVFHPNFRRNRLIYTSYMEQRTNRRMFTYLSFPERTSVPADSVVVEWKVSRAGVPMPRSYRQVIRMGVPVYDHTIRQMTFRGNNLYISHGDGSEQSRTAGGGQRNDALGKILRINPLQQGSKPYTVPSDNPFVGDRTYLDEIYALGLRNPHNLCFSKRGELFVVDVGRDNIEEINIIKPGGNYGWSEREGPFVHVEGPGGILTGIKPLPADDAKYGYIYPNAIVGHFGERGAGFVFQALAGSCPIENNSDLRGLMLYANFPDTGDLYFSTLQGLRNAKVTGPPRQLTQATTFRPQIFYDHDGNPRTPRRRVQNLREIVRFDDGLEDVARVDLRFGQGSRGEIYWSSKQNGAIYLITNSLPGSQ